MYPRSLFYSRGYKLANKVRKISLDTNEINKEIKRLQEIKNKVSSFPKDIEDILTEAVNYCMSITPIGWGENHLAYNTYWEKTPNGYRIVQEGDNVAYVEFGTGMAALDVTHPEATKFGWAYGVGPHIFVTDEGKTGWFFPKMNEQGVTRWYFTEGQRANMQLYKTAQWLEKRLNTEVKMTARWVKSKW